VAALDHIEEFDTARIPVTLDKGTNQLLIKTNDRQNRERHLWAIHCAVEYFERRSSFPTPSCGTK